MIYQIVTNKLEKQAPITELCNWQGASVYQILGANFSDY